MLKHQNDYKIHDDLQNMQQKLKRLMKTFDIQLKQLKQLKSNEKSNTLKTHLER